MAAQYQNAEQFNLFLDGLSVCYTDRGLSDPSN